MPTTRNSPSSSCSTRTSSASVSSEPPSPAGRGWRAGARPPPPFIGPTRSSTPSSRSAMLRRDVAVVEALRGAGGDRVGEQHRVGEAVDGDLAAGGERAERAAEDRAQQLRRCRPGSRSASACRRRPACGRSASSSSRACSGRCMRISVPRSTPPLISKLLERAAIRVSPIRRLGRSTSGRGPDPDAEVADDDGEPVELRRPPRSRADPARPPGRRGRRRSCRPR